MGNSCSQSENPNLLKCTFTKTYGSPSVMDVEDKLDWNVTRASLYEVPISLLAHVTKTAHYYLIFDICSEDDKGYILGHFTVDGVKHLEFHRSKSQAIFTSFEEKFLISKVELLKFWEITQKKVRDLKAVFDTWNRPFNLITSNCRKFTRFIIKRLVEVGQ